MLHLVLIAALAAPGIEFPATYSPVPSPVRIDECSASRDGLDLVYRFDLSNTSAKSVDRVEVAFVFENPGEKSSRGMQKFAITTPMDAGQSLRYSDETGTLRRADVSRGAHFGACSVVAVQFADGTHVEPPLVDAFATPVPIAAPSATPAS
jgi:hypothetical protein